MILPIVKYGHPVLREKGRRLETVTAEIEQLIGDMLETMYAARGIGLAAQQVGHALQLTVLDVRGVEDRPSTLWLAGEPADVAVFMPLVLINPEVKPLSPQAEGMEGCLSFPEIYAEISRPESVEVSALDRQGQTIQFRCAGLLARAVQHETDHLHGLLFIDRMSRLDRDALRAELESLQASTRAALREVKEGRR